MLVNVHRLTDEPIIVVTYKAPFQPQLDIATAQRQIAAILDLNEGVFFRIDDLSAANMGWNEFVSGINIATQDVPGSMTDARIRGILVGTYEMVTMASQSMKQEQYGATNTPMFDTLEEAISFARRETVA